MRKLALFVLLTFSIAPVFAAEPRRAEPPDELLARARSGLVAENLARIATDAQPAPLATKTFNVVASSSTAASSFKFTITPSPFVVNQGDMVTLNISVPSNDQSSAGHGFLMENYVESGIAVARGGSQTISFVANQPGPFTYICTVSSCGVGHTNMFGTFTVNAVVATPPAISSINPASGPATGGNVVAITGTNFQNGATVRFGSTPALGVSVNSSTSITATVPVHDQGAVTVTVTNPDGQSGTSSYTYTNPVLSITAVSPNTGSTSGGTAVTISGASFQSGATVTFGALAATDVVVVNSTTITAKTPLGPATEQLKVDVKVKNPDGNTATSTGAFTYSVPSAAVTDVSPASGATGGGTIVVITGSGFTTALSSDVTFGGLAATSVTVINPVTLIAVAPAHAAGAADVAVRIGNNTGTKTGGFTYNAVSAPPKKRSVKH